MWGWLLVLALGLIGGSFAGVVIYRWPKEQSLVRPRSHCEHCGTFLSGLDLLPVVGYVFLKGKCRYCQRPIDPFYPFLEIFMALLFAGIYFYWGFSGGTLGGLLLAWGLCVATVIDIKTGYIPDFISVGGIGVGLLQALFTSRLEDAGMGMLFLGGLFGFIWWISRGGMGFGDVKLAAAIGAFVGLYNSVVALVIAALGGGLVAVFLLLTKKGDWKTAVPFAPLLALGGYLGYLNLVAEWF